MSELATYATFAVDIADVARAMLAEASTSKRGVEVKPDRSFVTDLDRAIEQKLRGLIAARYPEHGIIGEEEGREREGAAWQWILDPIDGTAPFIAGVPVFGTLVALARDGVPVLGIMDLAASGNRWIGLEGEPTTLNGQDVRVRSVSGLDAAIMACMNPDFFTPEERKPLDALTRNTAWRIYGTSSLGYGLLASGRLDLAFDTRLQVYDYACYRPIIEGAGGIVTDWQGKPLTIESGRQVLAAGSRDLHAAAVSMVRGL